MVLLKSQFFGDVNAVPLGEGSRCRWVTAYPTAKRTTKRIEFSVLICRHFYFHLLFSAFILLCLIYFFLFLYPFPSSAHFLLLLP